MPALNDNINQSSITPNFGTPVFYANQPVITLPMMDKFHQRPEGTAKNAFRRHRDKLIKGEDFTRISRSELDSIQRTPNVLWPNSGGKSLILLFETGYLMLSKPFGDDLAWKIQRELVRGYFRAKAPAASDSEMLAEFAALKRMFLELRSDLAGSGRLARANGPTRRAHLDFAWEERRGFCPCCHKEAIINQVRAEFAQGVRVERYDKRLNRARFQETWPVCPACYKRLQKEAFRLAKLKVFEGYQADAQAWFEARGQTELKLG